MFFKQLVIVFIMNTKMKSYPKMVNTFPIRACGLEHLCTRINFLVIQIQFSYKSEEQEFCYIQHALEFSDFEG